MNYEGLKIKKPKRGGQAQRGELCGNTEKSSAFGKDKTGYKGKNREVVNNAQKRYGDAPHHRVLARKHFFATLEKGTGYRAPEIVFGGEVGCVSEANKAQNKECPGKPRRNKWAGFYNW